MAKRGATARAAAVAGAVLGLAIRGTSAQCTFDSGSGATFDLTPLQRLGSQPSYEVIDGDLPCTAQMEKNYTYHFNVCNSVTTNVPASCPHAEAALQVDDRAGTGECYVVGRYDAASPQWELVDVTDPSKGVRLTYEGDNCPHDQNNQPVAFKRKFHIDFTCADGTANVPTHALEKQYCEYTVEWPSVYGCPVECPIGGRQICSGNGHCGYDLDMRSPRCFCNDGYAGGSCGQKASSGDSSESASEAVTGILVALFVVSLVFAAGVFYLGRQVTKYRDDMNQFQVHSGAMDMDAI